ncbi:MAG: hypothetical protein JSR91_00225 [Proteobacteria bacterium]|nr:hypothetical protein [Pseudomonadota bacterium]
MNTDKPIRPEWPKFYVNAENGNRARFDCEGDVPPGWVLEGSSKAKAAQKKREEVVVDE